MEKRKYKRCDDRLKSSLVHPEVREAYRDLKDLFTKNSPLLDAGIFF